VTPSRHSPDVDRTHPGRAEEHAGIVRAVRARLGEALQHLALELAQLRVSRLLAVRLQGDLAHMRDGVQNVLISVEEVKIMVRPARLPRPPRPASTRGLWRAVCRSRTGTWTCRRSWTRWSGSCAAAGRRRAATCGSSRRCATACARPCAPRMSLRGTTGR
jgi:hypothetical protein